MPRIARSLAVTLVLACLPAAPLLAQVLPPPQNVLALNATASAEVPNDTLTVLLAARREGADAQQVQQALKQALDAALTEARKSAKPGQVEVRTGNFALYPRYAPKGGGISGWQGTAELIVEGKDIATIAQLAGRLPTMTVQHMAWGMSKEAREKVEGEVAAQAIARFRSKAADMSRQFGFGGYTIREVSVSGSEPGPPMPMRVRTMAQAADAAVEAVPVEPGKGTVAVNVNGSVQMSAK